MSLRKACDLCGKEADSYKQFWSLRNYYGIDGFVCAKCYEKVSHDGYGNPKNPTEYLMILLKQGNKDV